MLETAHDARTITCELIAEIQSVDIDSVFALVDRLDETIPPSASVSAPRPSAGPAAIRVQGAEDER